MKNSICVVISVLFSLFSAIEASSCPIDDFMKSWTEGKKDYKSYLKLVSSDETCVKEMVSSLQDDNSLYAVASILIANQNDTEAKESFFDAAIKGDDAALRFISGLYFYSRDGGQDLLEVMESGGNFGHAFLNTLRLSASAGQFGFLNLIDAQIAERDLESDIAGTIRLYNVVFSHADPEFFVSKVKEFHDPKNEDHPQRLDIILHSMQFIGKDSFTFLETFPMEEQPTLWQKLLPDIVGNTEELLSKELAERFVNIYLNDPATDDERRWVLLQFATMYKSFTLEKIFQDLNLSRMIDHSIVRAMNESNHEFTSYLSTILAESEGAGEAVSLLMKARNKNLYLRATGILLQLEPHRLESLLTGTKPYSGYIKSTLSSYAAFGGRDTDTDVQAASLAVLARAGNENDHSYLSGLSSDNPEVRRQVLLQGSSQPTPIFATSLSRVIRYDEELRDFAFELASSLIEDGETSIIDSLPIGTAILIFKNSETFSTNEHDVTRTVVSYMLKSQYSKQLLRQGLRHRDEVIAKRAQNAFLEVHSRKVSQLVDSLYLVVNSKDFLTNTKEYDLQIQSLLQNLSAHMATDYGSDDDQAKLLRLLPLQNLLPALRKLKETSQNMDDESVRKELEQIAKEISLALSSN